MRRGLTAGGLSTELPMSHLEGWQQPVNPGTSEPKVSPNPNPCEKQLPSNPQPAGYSKPTPCGGGGGGAEGLALGVETERCLVLCPPASRAAAPEMGNPKAAPICKGAEPCCRQILSAAASVLIYSSLLSVWVFLAVRWSSILIKTIPTAALCFPACTGWCRADVCPKLFMSTRSLDAPGAAARAELLEKTKSTACRCPKSQSASGCEYLHPIATAVGPRWRRGAWAERGCLLRYGRKRGSTGLGREVLQLSSPWGSPLVAELFLVPSVAAGTDALWHGGGAGGSCSPRLIISCPTGWLTAVGRRGDVSSPCSTGGVCAWGAERCPYQGINPSLTARLAAGGDIH